VTELLMPPVGPLVAARAYLLEELAARDNPLTIAVAPPPGEPTSYALISRPGGAVRGFLADYLIRVRVFDANAVRLEENAELLHRLLLTVSHRRITTEHGSVWIVGATGQSSPSTFDEPDVPLFGMQMAVFWTIGLRPEL